MKNKIAEAMQIAQRLKTFAAISEDPGSGSRMHVRQLTLAYNSTAGTSLSVLASADTYTHA